MQAQHGQAMSNKQQSTINAAPLADTNDSDGGAGNEDHKKDKPQIAPKTPGRIPLSDLIANPEEFSSNAPSATPFEQVTWKHVPGLLQSPSSSVRSTQKSRKRAHSSSPASSQSRKSKRFRGEDGIKKLSQRSPLRRSPNHDDPAAVLWNHYADKKTNEPLLPPLPPLQLSPSTPSGSKKDATFRRTASCGNEWPISKAKRRKTTHHDPHSTTKQIFASRRKEMLKSNLPRQSKVSILLDSVEQSFAARARDNDDPSSSSPLPERMGTEEQVLDPEGVIKHQTPSPRKQLQPSPMSLHGSSPLKSKAASSSDYGDLNFDDDDLDDIEDALTQGQVQADAMFASAPVARQEANSTSFSHSEAVLSNADAVPPKPNSRLGSKAPEFEVFDEFDDDDLLNEELHQLAKQVDSQKHAPTTVTVGSRPVPIAAVGGDATFDDEFDDALIDGFEDGLEDGLVDSDIPDNRQERLGNRAIKRYLILDVFQRNYDVLPGKQRPERLLSVKDERTKRVHAIILRQSWYDMNCHKGAYIHVVGQFDSQGQCIVDDKQSMVILHPDHLISATSIGDAATSCLRKAVLQDRIKATSPPSEPQVYGNILHEVFQEAFKQNQWDANTFLSILQKLLPCYLESLYEIGKTIPEATEALMSKVSLFRAWAERFVSATFQTDADVRDRNGGFAQLAINKLLEVEEHVWSPMYGVKGNIDATIQARIRLPNDCVGKTIVLPLELKTGQRDNNESHRAQTALYTLLLSDRYDVEVLSGILYYMETSKTIRIEAVRNEIREMIQWRNRLASYVHDKLELPPMLQRESQCKRCYAQTSCFTYHKLAESGDGDTSGLKEIFEDAVSHLNPQHQSFFKHWDDLLTKEERDSMKFKRELWTLYSDERQQLGRCFSDVVIEPGSARENIKGPKVNRYVYSFVKQETQPGFSFTESQLSVGEPIVISDEKGHFALALGYITSVRPRRVTVAVDRKLQNARKKTKDFHSQNNQSFVGIMEVKRDGVPLSSPAEDEEPIVYRLDKDEFSNGMATVRNNLIRIMEKDLAQAKELRDLVVERKAPSFKIASTAYTLSGPASQANINVDQRAAIEKVMGAKDYALVLGMPGTGKTTTIAHIIRALVSQGKSILLTSYTHTAVDNILLKIKDDKIPTLRLGAIAKVHPEVQSFADLAAVPKTSIEELERSWTNSKVVATTCLSINHGIFNHRMFDYCIVDEASQITLPVCLGPIRLARTFVLVGDHYQLPPLVQNDEAREGGLDQSLFKLLSDSQPAAVVSLEHQYRMAEDIMLLSNTLIYSGRLKCGTTSVATRTLQVPSLQAALDAHHHRASKSQLSSSSAKHCTANHANCYLRLSLLPHNRVLFLNTDTVTNPENAQEVTRGTNQRITNPVESKLTAHLLTTLIRAGIAPTNIGVITFYRSQLALLRQDVKAIAGTNAAVDVEMHTADKYQGRDKEVILLSCVRSNNSHHVGELLKDWRRLNVAITRAKSKLIIVGSKSTLERSGVPVLEGLVKIVAEKRWIINLPENAVDGGHKFESVLPSQTQMPSAPAAPTSTEAVAPKQKPLPNTHTIEARKPLSQISANSRPISNISHNLTNKLTAPFKPPRPQPQKVVHGEQPVDIENLLEKRPILRDIANELANPPPVIFSSNDFDDDDMLIDF